MDMNIDSQITNYCNLFRNIMSNHLLMKNAINNYKLKIGELTTEVELMKNQYKNEITMLSDFNDLQLKNKLMLVENELLKQKLIEVTNKLNAQYENRFIIDQLNAENTLLKQQLNECRTYNDLQDFVLNNKVEDNNLDIHASKFSDIINKFGTYIINSEDVENFGLYAHIDAQVNEQITGQINDQITEQLTEQVNDQINKHINEQIIEPNNEVINENNAIECCNDVTINDINHFDKNYDSDCCSRGTTCSSRSTNSIKNQKKINNTGVIYSEINEKIIEHFSNCVENGKCKCTKKRDSRMKPFTLDDLSAFKRHMTRDINKNGNKSIHYEFK